MRASDANTDTVATARLWNGLPDSVVHALARSVYAQVAAVRIPLAVAGGTHDWLLTHWPAEAPAVARAAIDPPMFPPVWQGHGTPVVARETLCTAGPAFSGSVRLVHTCEAMGLTQCVRVAVPLPLDVALECILYFRDDTARLATDTACAAAVLQWLPEFRAAMRAHSRLLTPRETECLRLAFLGLTAGEVAQRLRCSDRTVNFHYANVMAKLGVNNKLAAALLASWMGLI
jgi:DNA-binding CsgD family transcriptional regulator